MSKSKSSSIEEALKVLNEVLEQRGSEMGESFSEVKNFLSKAFPEAAEVFKNVKENAGDRAGELKDSAKKSLHEVDSFLRHQIKHHPVRSVGIAAIGGIILGVLLAKKN